MRGLKAVADETRIRQQLAGGANIWLPLYYNDKTDTVYTKDGRDRELVTHFLNEVTPKEVKETVKKWLWR
jgi:hypothetical protein